MTLPPPPMHLEKDRLIAGIALARPDLVDRYAETISQTVIFDSDAARVMIEVLRTAEEGTHMSPDTVRGALFSTGTLRELILTDPNNDAVENSFREMLGLEPSWS